MPKYYEYKIHGYYLYFTSKCILEAMHTHASDRKLTEAGAAKFFVKSNGDSTIEKKGDLSDQDVLKIQKFIKENYLTMFEKWREYSQNGFYGEN